MKPKIHRLGDLQLRLMKTFWDNGEMAVTEVHDRIEPETGLAFTTVATMLRKMEARGLVNHRAEGRRFLYKATVSAAEVTRNMADDLLDKLFGGSLAQMVNHLLTTREVSRAELSKLEDLIAERKKK